MKRTQWLLAWAALSSLSIPGTAFAGKAYPPGVSDSEIRIGQTMPYSGPVSAYGTIGRAEAAYFRMVNEQGGINGRMLVLRSLDDGYLPPKTVEQTRKLIEQEGVLLIFGTFGTAPNAAVQRYLNERGVPQLFPISGASRWGDPGHFPWTMGLQPTYRIEASVIARYILQERPNARIAVLSEDDDFGRDYLGGLKTALGDKAKSMIVGEATYQGSDPTVDSQIVMLQASGADVFVDVSTAKFTAQAIRKAYDIGWKPLYFVFSGATARAAVLEPAGLEKARGLMSVQWAKDPTDPRWRDDRATQDWRAWMARYYPDGNPADSFNVAGYNFAMTLVQVLKQCGDDLSRANVMRQAANLDVELPMVLPGIRLHTGPRQFFAVREMQLKRFNGAVWESFGEVIRAE